MTARIASATPPFSPDVQALLDRTMPAGVPPLRLFTTLARDERLMKKFFAGGLLDRGHLSLRQREIVIHRTTALCRSAYEWGVHAAWFAPRVGLLPRHLQDLAHAGPLQADWTDDERALITLCDELHAGCTLGDAAWAALTRAFSEEAILELLLLAGFYRTVSYLTNALQLPPETFGVPFPAAAQSAGRLHT